MTSNEFRLGVRLCLDWGKARIGVAACDREALLCYPVETIANNADAFNRVSQIVAEYEPIELILGFPLDLRGAKGPAAIAMTLVADRLSNELTVPIRLVDERLSTANATKKVAAAGKNSKQRRNMIDQAAAVAILEQALTIEKNTGKAAGELVTHEERADG